MRPLKKETEHIAALLVQGGDSPTELANTVIEAVDAIRAERTTYAITFRIGSSADSVSFYCFGPYSTKAQALKAWDKHPARGEATGWAVAPMTSAEGITRMVTELDTPPAARGDFATVRADAEAIKAGRKPGR